MNYKVPRPTCFIAMPFGKKPPLGKRKPLINFDRIYHYIKKAVLESGLEYVRADFEASGGFIHRQMYERLLIAEYLVADLTMANPNVLYEVGVRHGSRARATLLICADNFIGKLPFDIKPLRVLNYSLGNSGTISEKEGKKLTAELSQRLQQAVTGVLPLDNPILQVTEVASSGSVQHEKTDVFIKRMRYASELGERIHAAISNEPSEAIPKLQAIEDEVLNSPQVVTQLHTKLISLYLGYRELKAYRQMNTLFDRLPEELQRTPVAIEQLALALNRLAEEAASAGKKQNSKTLRNQAIRRLNELDKEKWTSETYGILGRIYKGKAEAEQQFGNTFDADAALKRAIEIYEIGFRSDPRDYYPGVNAVTLRLRRGRTEDLDELSTLIPVVRFSVERAPAPEDEMERYWQEATKLELACAAKDWETAKEKLLEVLSLNTKNWMRETTIKNLKIQKKARSSDPKALGSLNEIISNLQPK